MKRFVSICVLLLAASGLYAQPVAASEGMYVHLNSDFFVTGETIYFKLYAPSDGAAQSSLSRVGYLELIGPDGSPALQTKVGLIQGAGHGDLFLNSTLNTGNYTVVAYTQWQRNYDLPAFFRTEITIINPLRIQSQEGVHISSDEAVTQATGESETPDGIQLLTEKRSFGTREKVTLQFKATQQLAGPGSLSVHYQRSKGTTGITSPVPTSKGSSSAQHLPEWRGKILSGRASLPNGKPLAAHTLYISVAGKSHHFFTTGTDKGGFFHARIGGLEGRMQLLIEADTIGDAQIVLQNEYLSDYTALKPSLLTIPSSLAPEIEKRSIYAQVENAYFRQKMDSVRKNEVTAFYRAADKVYRLDDFTRFPTMEDILREYVTEIAVHKRETGFAVSVIDGKTRSALREPPLILVDGIRIKDPNEFMELDPLKYERLEIVTHRYAYGPSLSGGIIYLSSYPAFDAAPGIKPRSFVSYESIQPSRKYYMPQIKNGSRIPEYRVQLLWEPSIQFVNGIAEVSFYTGDVEGPFEVVLEQPLAGRQFLRTRWMITVKKL